MKKVYSMIAGVLVVLATVTVSAASFWWLLYHPKIPKSLLR